MKKLSLQRQFACLFLLACTIGYASAQVRQELNLDGEWQAQVKPQGSDLAHEWVTVPDHFLRSIHVPGIWQAQGIGSPRDMLRHRYRGAVLYVRSVRIPSEWAGKKIFLRVGGSFTYTTVYVNSMRAGYHAGFSTPFEVDVTNLVRLGEDNRFALEVSNVKDVSDIHSVPANQRDPREVTGAVNFAELWGGLYRSVALVAIDPVRIKSVHIVPHIAPTGAEFQLQLGNDSNRNLSNVEVLLQIALHGTSSPPVTARFSLRLPKDDEVRQTVPVAIPQGRLWSPDSPSLYDAAISLRIGGKTIDQTNVTFGLREIRAEGTHLLLNGKPLYIRGYGDDSVEIIGGGPPSSKKIYLERMQIAKSYGFNAVRFHSTTPTEECFEAADEVGMLVESELPVIYQEYLLPHREFLQNELVSILHSYQNHPSWFLFTLGNEFSLRRIPDAEGKVIFTNALKELVALGKTINPGLLISSNTGYLVPPMDVAIPYQGLSSDLPNIKHEYGGYHCSLPDFSLIPRLVGVFDPGWLEEEKSEMEAQGLMKYYRDSLSSSVRLLNVSAKAFIEKLRGMPEFSGYFYWLINDYPAGTPEGPSWYWGWLNYFWEPKAITTEESRQMNAPVLALIDAPLNSRSFWIEEPKMIRLSVSNFGSASLENSKVTWEILQKEKILASGTLPIHSAPLGAISSVGEIQIPRLPLMKASEVDLRVRIVGVDGASYMNRWKFWAFPRRAIARQMPLPVTSLLHSTRLKRFYPFLRDWSANVNPQGVLVTEDLRAEAVHFLEQGGRVVLLAGPGRFGRRTSYFPVTGGAMGIYVRSNSPALSVFPNDGFCDLQFFNLFEGGVQFDLSNALEPIVGGIQMIRGSKNLFKKVSYLAEAKVGRGKLLVSTLNIEPNLDEANPEVVSIFDDLLRYAASPQFQPTTVVTREEIDNLRVPYTEMIH